MPDEHLAVAVEPGADADGRDRSALGDARGDGCGNRFEDEREAAGRLERARVAEQRAAFSAVRPCALKPPSIVADCGVRPMWPITGMPASTIARTRESIAPAPSSFTASAPASFTKRIALRTRILVGDLERAERHVRDDERTLRPAGDCSCEDEHLLHRRRDCRGVAEDGHRRGVADEHEIRARFVGQPRRRARRTP